MYSNDIYIRVGEFLKEKGIINNPLISYTKERKKEAINNLTDGLLEYSCQKLYEQGDTKDVVMDLSVLFDRLDSYIAPNEQEKFYQNYVFCMLNTYNSLENTNYMWSPEMEKTKDLNYPRFEKEGNYLEFFKTGPESTNKETALWLLDYLQTKYVCKIYEKH